MVRLRLLARLDAQIDEEAAVAHLNARLALDESLPLPYLGVDADPVAGGMLVAHVYPLTAAEASGLVPGDLVVSLSGDATTSKVTLGRAIRSHAVGTPVELRVQRSRQELTLAATLGSRPEEDEDEEEQFPELTSLPS